MRRRVFHAGETDSIADNEKDASEAGDTLIEVLFAIVILGIAGVALLTGFATSITSSAQHRQLVSQADSVRAATDEVLAQVQDASDAAFTACPTTYTPTWTLSGSFQVTNYNVQYWNGTAFSTSCPSVTTNPQLWTMTIGSGSYSTTVSTVIYDPQPVSPTAGTTPSKLVFLSPTTANPGSGTVNGPVTPQPIVAVEDVANNIVYSDASSVTLSVASGSPGSLSSSCDGVENNGIFSFSNCSLSAVGTYTMTAKDSNTSVASASASYTVSTAPQAKIGFTTTAVSGGATNSPTLGKITVQVEDAFGNADPGGAVTVNLASSSSKGLFAATSGGSAITSVTIPTGQSTASFYYGDTTAGSPIITASASGLQTGLQTETITPDAPNKLAISTAPPSSFAAGTAFNVGVTIEDQYGNAETTGSTGSTDTVQLALSSGSFSTGHATVTAAASNGVATFSNLQIDTPGNYTVTATDTTRTGVTAASMSFTVTPAPPNKLAFTSTVTGNHPVGTTASVGPFQVQVQDQFGNAITNSSGSPVSLLLSTTSAGTTFFTPTSGGSSAATVTIANGASSSAPFYYSDTKSGQPTISASATVNSVLVSGTSNGFTMTPTAESKLAITTQPASPTAAGATIPVGVTVEDQFGNPITTGTGSNDTIHVALSSGSFASGTTSVAASGGVAALNLTITTPGSYTITATDTTHGTITAATTNSFTVTPAAENKLVITTQPAASLTAGGTVSVGVTLEDQYGNTITTGNSGSNDTIHVALSSGSFAAGTTSVAASNGVATFSGLQVNGAGTYTITATNTTHGTVTAATTSSFTVSPAAENQLGITTQPASPVAAGATITVGVTVEDQYGNPITTGNTGSNDTIHVALSSGSFASGTTSVVASNGVATFNNLTITTPGSYTITTSDTTHGTITAATTNSFTVTPAAENKLVITAQPSSITAGGTVSVGVTIEDQYGNPITTGSTGSNDTIHMALSSGSFAAGTTSVVASNGVASFSGLQVNTVGSYTIAATDTTHGTVTAATTNSFTVTPAAENKLVITRPTGLHHGRRHGVGRRDHRGPVRQHDHDGQRGLQRHYPRGAVLGQLRRRHDVARGLQRGGQLQRPPDQRRRQLHHHRI